MSDDDRRVGRRELFGAVGGVAALGALTACKTKSSAPAGDRPGAAPAPAAPADAGPPPWKPKGKAPCPADFAVAAPPRPYHAGRVVPFALVARGGEAERIQISADRSYVSMNFNGQVPSPTLRLTEGDKVQFTLTNEGILSHSIDFHAARTPWSKHYQSIAPGQKLEFEWTAANPGVFMYHCGTDPVIMHIADGMYGAVIVDPKEAAQAGPRVRAGPGRVLRRRRRRRRDDEPAARRRRLQRPGVPVQAEAAAGQGRRDRAVLRRRRRAQRVVGVPRHRRPVQPRRARRQPRQRPRHAPDRRRSPRAAARCARSSSTSPGSTRS